MVEVFAGRGWGSEETFLLKSLNHSVYSFSLGISEQADELFFQFVQPFLWVFPLLWHFKEQADGIFFHDVYSKGLWVVKDSESRVEYQTKDEVFCLNSRGASYLGPQAKV